MIRNSKLKNLSTRRRIENSESNLGAVKILVQGDVQGVFYRHFAKKEADKLGLIGWCHNEMDGSVLIFIQGEESNLNNFIEWTREGSPMAVVKSISVNDSEVDNSLKGFSIK